MKRRGRAAVWVIVGVGAVALLGCGALGIIGVVIGSGAFTFMARNDAKETAEAPQIVDNTPVRPAPVDKPEPKVEHFPPVPEQPKEPPPAPGRIPIRSPRRSRRRRPRKRPRTSRRQPRNCPYSTS